VWVVLRIVVIEQDKISTIENVFDNEVEYIFVYNDGFYNRVWVFNVCVKEFPESDYYFFADNDIVY